jgi:hypothetical protein
MVVATTTVASVDFQILLGVFLLRQNRETILIDNVEGLRRGQSRYCNIPYGHFSYIAVSFEKSKENKSLIRKFKTQNNRYISTPTESGNDSHGRGRRPPKGSIPLLQYSLWTLYLAVSFESMQPSSLPTTLIEYTNYKLRYGVKHWLASAQQT